MRDPDLGPGMPDEPDRGTADAAMSTEEALNRMAEVTELTRGLRTRTEGLTLVLWGICMAASYLTLGAPFLYGGPRHRPDEHMFLITRAAPLVWFLIALVTTLGLWRSAALSIKTGLTTPKLLTFFLGWIGLFIVTTVAFTFIEGGSPRAWHLAGWGIVIGLFALLNPLGFTPQGRVASGIAGLVILTLAGYGYAAGLFGPQGQLLTGAGLGAPLLAAGLYLLFRG